MGRFIVITGALLISLGCAGFRGPGSFNGPGDLQPPSTSKSVAYDSPRSFDADWPVKQVRITQEFAPVSNPSHQGVDLGGWQGAPIYSAHPGVVIYTGAGFNGYGKMIIVEFSEKWATLYAHLKKIHVTEGEVIPQGKLLGRMGSTGRSTGTHLHFELIRNKQPIDPLSYLNHQPRIRNASSRVED